jgi:predicted DNA-binding protein (MmcQ/YjbR family)
MNIEQFRNYCLSLPATEETFPFDEVTLVFKVAGKMFALADVDLFTSINLKCDPELAVELRERYPAVQPGYHMSKVHWNTVEMDGSIPDALLKEWIKNSYDLVVASMTRKHREANGL